MFANVISLGFKRMLQESRIYTTQGGDQSQALRFRIYRCAALLADIQGIGGDPDGKVFAEFRRTLQNAQVADVEYIERAECNDALQIRGPLLLMA
jgi:hypothetical protein